MALTVISNKEGRVTIVIFVRQVLQCMVCGN